MERINDALSVKEIVEYLISAITPRKRVLELAFDRGLREEKKRAGRQSGGKLENWILVEMLAKLIELRDDGSLESVEGEHHYPLPKLRFSILYTEDIERDLDKGIISDVLRKGFEDFCSRTTLKSMKPLGENAIVKKNGEKLRDGWIVENNDRRYFVRKRGSKLNIHALDHERCDLWWNYGNEEHWLEVKTLVIIDNKSDVDEGEIITDIKKRYGLRSSEVDKFHHLSIVFSDSPYINVTMKRLEQKYEELPHGTVWDVDLSENKMLRFMLYSQDEIEYS